MPRADFENLMRTTYGVTTVRDGTYAEQDAGASTNTNLTPAGQHIPRAQWTSWSALPSDAIYPQIVTAIRTVATQLGGVPEIREVVFSTQSPGARTLPASLRRTLGLERRTASASSRSTAPARGRTLSPPTAASQARHR
jgi:hypothetical protein